VRILLTGRNGQIGSALEHERTLLWSDPALGIQWPLQGEAVVADKDQRGTPLASAEAFD